MIKQLITLSLENWVFASVQSMNKKIKTNDPKSSETALARNFLSLSISGTGATTRSLFSYTSSIILDTIAAMMPPRNWATIYIIPNNLLEPRLEFFLSMNTMVTAGLKCAPDIACPNSVMIHIPSIIPDYWSPMSKKNMPRTAVPISSTMNLEIFTKKYCLALRLVLFKLSSVSYGES